MHFNRMNPAVIESTPNARGLVKIGLILDFMAHCLECLVWWPRELNALQLQKTHAN